VTPEQWARLRAHFEELCELEPECREVALAGLKESDELLTRLRRMLDADGGSRLRDNAVEQAPALHQRVDAKAEPDRIGERLGAWRIVAPLGAGGMGCVYRAVRDDGRYRAEAAIKTVAHGVDAARFVRERNVLARLSHPGIAGLLDGGECPDGRPYLVMEYVDGLTIDRYCATHALPALARVRLVLAAARAAAYAHARAVLHRDLKPDNLLVDGSGTVKLLDFGVAKLLDVDSAPANNLTAARYFTPRYAAPEQFADQTATTATDVFALAVMLYELLAGRHPFAGEDGQEDTSRRVLTGEPTSLRRALQRRSDARVGLEAGPLRDLDAVLDRALAHDPARRYQSMDAFADELERVLEDQPVQTRRAPWRERALRWARSNQLAAAGLLLGLLSLALGTALAVWQAQEARHQRDAAVLEAARAERVAAFLSEVFSAPNPARSKGADVSARDLLDRGRDRLADELVDDPPLRARMHMVIAETYRSLGFYDEAETLLRQALDSADGGSRARLLLELGWLHAYRANYAESARHLQESADLALAEGAQDTHITALTRIATPLINLGRYDDAEAAVTRALELHERQVDADPVAGLAMKGLLANIAFSRRQLDRAEVLFGEVLAAQRALRGAGHSSLSTTHNNLGAVAMLRGRVDDAETHYRQATAIARDFFGVDNDQVALPIHGLGISLRRQDRGDEALVALREAAAIYSGWSGESHRNTINTRLDALELASLLGADATEEISLLTRALAELAPDAPNACRLESLRQLNLARPDPAAARAARACLLTHSAPQTLQLVAEIAVARADDAVDPDLVTALLQGAAALPVPDPPLQRAIARLQQRQPAPFAD
jgi:eukaryotic-like serine/threonine-protein kinase